MKRLIWLLALPWVVQPTTWTWKHSDCANGQSPVYEVRYKGHYAGVNCCQEDTDACQDYVFALNEAHAKRKGEEFRSGVYSDPGIIPELKVIDHATTNPAMTIINPEIPFCDEDTLAIPCMVRPK